MVQFSFQKKIIIFLIVIGIILLIFFSLVQKNNVESQSGARATSSEVTSTESLDPWKEKLTREEYAILRNKGTEVPYTSDLLYEKRNGTYYAVDTKEPIFRSEDKYDSGTGWPSFTKPIRPGAVSEARDTEFGMSRTEVLTTAGGHLGHVFTDGPEPSGLRYCMNGKAMYFVPDGE